ncbi:hypothetical protein CSA08_04555 [Candidatus Gracilibacteria bacterium]|nr:MAG: hypothetical protein CSA08_04555 [Candidatus Gracilibacteria bacterium]
MSKKEGPKTDNLKNALCYVPFVGILFFFIEDNKSPEFKKHIKYGTILLFVFLILNILLGWIGLLRGLLTVLYFGGISFIMWKIYSGEEVDLSYIDKAEEGIKKKMDN